MAHRFTIFFLISCALLSGCANGRMTPIEVQQQQQIALGRWHNCLDRVSTQAVKDPLEITSNLITNICDGHRRDVLLTFPASMERQLDALLKERGMRSAALQMMR